MRGIHSPIITLCHLLAASLHCVLSIVEHDTVVVSSHFAFFLADMVTDVCLPQTRAATACTHYYPCTVPCSIYVLYSMVTNYASLCLVCANVLLPSFPLAAMLCNIRQLLLFCRPFSTPDIVSQTPFPHCSRELW